MNVLVLLGSLRKDSLNARLAEAVIEELPAGAHGRLYSGLDDLPHYSEERDGDNAPAAVREFRAALRAADAVVLVTPEYNGSLPSVLKNALDWGSRPRGASALDAKPAAVIAASPSPRDAQWVREDAVRVLRVAGAQPLAETFGLGSAHQHLVDGRLSDVARSGVRNLLAKLSETQLAAV